MATHRHAALVLLLMPLACERRPVDSGLDAYIASIKAVDNHAHPMRTVAPGAPADTEYDALPLDGLPPFQLPVRLRPDSPGWIAAAQALYRVRSDSFAVYRDALKAARERVARDLGTGFPAWALDQAGIDVMLSNRIVLGAGLTPPRFRWVAFDDALLYPLDTREEAARTPDTRALFPREAALLKRYLRDLHVEKLPATFDAYLRSVVVPTLESQRRAGAVAIKFEAAYLRSLDFDDADSAAAARTYGRYVAGGTPSRGEYKVLQDHLFRVIARESGRLGLAVHLHVAEGFGGFYATLGSAPHLLEHTFNDSTLRGTNFVIVHGGWPLVAETMSLLAKPNVYADLSLMSLALDPPQLAVTLRLWLAEWPEKVLFATDAFDGGIDQGWEQGAWLGASTVRHSLARALTGMMRSGEISRARAEAIARMVMRENAVRLYHLAP